MNYAPKTNSTPHFQSSRARTGMSFPVKVVTLVAIVLAILYIFFPRVLPYMFMKMVYPIWKADNDARLGTVTIDELRRVYSEINGNGDKNNVLLKENEDLKAQLNRGVIMKPLLAAILKKPPFSAYDSFIIDVGEADGVQKGDRVYTLGSIPIGEITDVNGPISHVLLYSSAGQKFDILIGPSNIQATAIGKGGGSFEVSLPRDTKIKLGDSVQVPGLGTTYVGRVQGFASEPSEPFAKILFSQPINMYEQKWVVVDIHRNIGTDLKK
jgi:cell shape-determining protein MreC